jgi:hypothetical protein
MKTRAEMYLFKLQSHTETQLQQWFPALSAKQLLTSL